MQNVILNNLWCVSENVSTLLHVKTIIIFCFELQKYRLRANVQFSTLILRDSLCAHIDNLNNHILRLY